MRLGVLLLNNCLTRNTVLSLCNHFGFLLPRVWLLQAPRILQLYLRLLTQYYLLVDAVHALDAISVQILLKIEHVNFDRISDTLTGTGFVGDLEPGFDGEVDGFGYIEARVEAGVVASRPGDDEFTWSVADFAHSYTFFQQVFWMNQCRLVPQEFTAVLRFLRKL